MNSNYESCRLCPRECRVNRCFGEKGVCGETEEARIALATLHYGEEPPLTGTGGAGAVFFTGCTLRCPHCQNRQISREGFGGVVSGDELSAIFLQLQRRGAENINLVTGTQFIPHISEAVAKARSNGLSLPILWNSSGFENAVGLELLKPFVDTYLPDLKTVDPDTAERLYRAPGYPGCATDTILEMSSRGEPAFNSRGMLVAGTIVRHLVLPGMLENTGEVLQWYRTHLEGKALISVMFQYIPLPEQREPAPDRAVEDAEYYQVIGMLEDLGIEDGFIQEMDYESTWMPDFDRTNPFPDSFSRVVWHWRYGYVDQNTI